MRNWPIIGIILTVAFFTFCDALTFKRPTRGMQRDDDPCTPVYDNIFAANFIDYSRDNLNDLYFSADSYIDTLADVCQATRQIAGTVTGGYLACPYNITNHTQSQDCMTYLRLNDNFYDFVFDLKTSVATFLSQKQYSSFDPKKNIPPFAIIYIFTDLTNNVQSFLDGVNALHNAGYEVLILSNVTTRAQVATYRRAVPMANIANINGLWGWLLSRINARFKVLTYNQTAISGNFTSQNYPNRYPMGLALQEFYVAAPSDDYIIQFNFQDFDTEYILDELRCYNGQLMNNDDFAHWFSGRDDQTKPPFNYTFAASSASCRFMGESDDTYRSTYRGFNVTWTAIPKSSTMT